MILWLKNNKGALILYAIIVVFTLMLVNNSSNNKEFNTNEYNRELIVMTK